MSIVRTPSQVSPAFSLSNKSTLPDVVEMLALFVSQVSEAMGDRISSVLAPFPYATGATFVTSSQVAEVKQIAASVVLDNSGSVSVTLFSNVFPINIFSEQTIIVQLYGVAQGVGLAYPLGYNSGGLFIFGFVNTSLQTVELTYSPSLAGYTVYLTVQYV